MQEQTSSALLLLSERNDRAFPFYILARLRSGYGFRGITPSVAGIPAGTATEEIQHTLAFRIESEKQQYQETSLWCDGIRAADYLVVVHAAVGQSHGAHGMHGHAFATWQSRSQYDGIKQVPFQTNVPVDGAIVKRARERRDKIQFPG